MAKRTRTAGKDDELLTGVARSIGSTLGTIVAKLSPPLKATPRKKKLPRKGKAKSSAATQSRKKKTKRRS